MTAAAARAPSPLAWTPAEHLADARRELRTLAAEVEATMRPRAVPDAVSAPRPAPSGRLLDEPAACAYLGHVSKSYLRALTARGVLKRVELPACDGSGRRARLSRYDRAELDKWIDSMKG